MKQSRFFCFAVLFAMHGGLTACGVDDRAITYQYRSLGNAGATASAGRGDAGDDTSGNGSDAGATDGESAGRGGGSAGNASSAGDSGTAGQTEVAGSANGTAGSAGNGGAASGGSASGGTASGGTNQAGSLGQAGKLEFPCGDLNQDAVDDCSQTLVQNSRFDSAVSGWDAEPSLTQQWDNSNATDKPGSGSLMLSNSAPVAQAIGSIVIGSRQCIPVTPTTNYDFAARVMLAAGETSGQAGVNVWLFDDDACQGNLVSGNTPISGGATGKWTVLSGKFWVPGNVHSMYVRLVAIKPFAQPSLKVLIDDVLVAKH